jgi:hypothetical protein
MEGRLDQVHEVHERNRVLVSDHYSGLGVRRDLGGLRNQVVQIRDAAQPLSAVADWEILTLEADPVEIFGQIVKSAAFQVEEAAPRFAALAQKM